MKPKHVTKSKQAKQEDLRQLVIFDHAIRGEVPREPARGTVKPKQAAEGWSLIDGEKKNWRSPETFQIPPELLRRNVAGGVRVKISLQSRTSGGPMCAIAIKTARALPSNNTNMKKIKLGTETNARNINPPQSAHVSDEVRRKCSTNSMKAFESGWSNDEYGALCQFEHYPLAEAQRARESKDALWVVETIDWTLADKKTVHHNRYYVNCLWSAIGLAAHIELDSCQVIEEVFAIRQADHEEAEAYLRVWEVEQTLPKPSLTEIIASGKVPGSKALGAQPRKGHCSVK